MLYVDCGHTVEGTHYTGIQRFVRQVLRQSAALLGPPEVAALRAGPQGWATYRTVPSHPLECLPPVHLGGSPVRLDEDAHVLLADRFWHTGAWDALDALLASPARISVVVYDLLSIHRPALFPQGVGDRFGRYLRTVLPRADNVACLSSFVAHELAEWQHGAGVVAPRASVVPPGQVVWEGAPVAPEWLPPEWRDGSSPFVLQVGTLEPRKNHALTLQAMQSLWRRGLRARLLFVGQTGWGMDGLAEAMRRMPEWGDRLLWVSACDDPRLDWCLRHAAAVLFPSACEGYGLPLAEAAAAGAAVIASDTPIHREVARSLPAGYDVRTCAVSPEALAGAIEASLATRREAHALPPGRSWRRATADLLAACGVRTPQNV